MNHHDHSNCDDHGCHKNWTNPSVHQTLDELEFERGIWNAALSGDLEDVKKKLEQSGGTCANAVDKSGYTPLHYASRSGHLDICRLLLQHGAKVNATTSSGHATALHRAAFMGHSSVIALLVDHGAQLLALDSDGMTPLHKAADRSHLKSFQMLVEAEPKTLDVEDKRGRKPHQLFHTADLQRWWEEEGQHKYTSI